MFLQRPWRVSFPDRSFPEKINSSLHRAVLLWERPVWSAVLSLVVYGLFALGHGVAWQASAYAYFNFLADAFLHGQLNLRMLPASVHDLSYIRGQYYLYWPPLPALLLMPFVALFGVNFSDVVFTVVLASLNVALVALLLRYACRKRIVRLSTWQRALLVVFFALGTVHVTLAPYGRVWFTGQLVGFCCVVLAYLFTLALRGKAAFALTGVAVAGALLTRNHLVFAGLWPACYLIYTHHAEGKLRLVKYTIWGLIPLFIATALLALYNWARFGSVLDNGLAYHLMDPVFAGDYQRYGAFNVHYLAANLYYQYVASPWPIRPETYYGGSLFLLSPVFLAAWWGIREGHPRWSVWAFVVTILLVAAPILLLMGTGWKQFGPRYTLDFTVPLLLLTAMGVRRWPPRILAWLTVLSVVQYLGGAFYLMLAL